MRARVEKHFHSLSSRALPLPIEKKYITVISMLVTQKRVGWSLTQKVVPPHHISPRAGEKWCSLDKKNGPHVWVFVLQPVPPLAQMDWATWRIIQQLCVLCPHGSVVSGLMVREMSVAYVRRGTLRKGGKNSGDTNASLYQNRNGFHNSIQNCLFYFLTRFSSGVLISTLFSQSLAPSSIRKSPLSL